MKSSGNIAQLQIRTSEENRAWLKKKAAEMERSANWLANKIITEAREKDLGNKDEGK